MTERRLYTCREDNWTPAETDSLILEWNRRPDLTTVKLAEMLSLRFRRVVTKDSITGKIHRLRKEGRVASRASPIKRDKDKPVTAKPKPAVVVKPVPVERLPAPLVLPPTLSTVVRRCGPCQWPVSSGRPWRYCDAPSEPGRVYCAEHRARAVQPKQASAEA